jgi:hypothetical protein
MTFAFFATFCEKIRNFTEGSKGSEGDCVWAVVWLEGI